MAPSRVISNACQLKLNWSGPTRTWANVFGGLGNPTLPVINQALANTLMTAISASFTSSGLAPLIGTTVSLQSVSIRSLNAANQPEFVSNVAPVSGGATGDLLPLSVAACVTVRTTLSGKSFRGRMYITGFNEAQNDATGRILTAANTAAQTFVNGISVNLAASGISFAVLSFARDQVVIPQKTIPAKAGFATAASSFQVRNTKWESQRRRTGRT